MRELEKELQVLTSHWDTQDCFESRKNRDWKKFDALDALGKLQTRIEEAEEYNKKITIKGIKKHGKNNRKRIYFKM